MLRRVKTQLVQREELMSMKSLFIRKAIVVAQTILRCPLASLLQSNWKMLHQLIKSISSFCLISVIYFPSPDWQQRLKLALK